MNEIIVLTNEANAEKINNFVNSAILYGRPVAVMRDYYYKTQFP